MSLKQKTLLFFGMMVYNDSALETTVFTADWEKRRIEPILRFYISLFMKDK